MVALIPSQFVSVIMAFDGQGNDVSQQMFQRLLTRIDVIEHNLILSQKSDAGDTRTELEGVKEKVRRMERARQLEAQDLAWADAWARAPRVQPPTGHRGPGAEPAPQAATLPKPASPSDQAAREKKRAFSNHLVKSRETSRGSSPHLTTADMPPPLSPSAPPAAALSPPEQYVIASPLHDAIQEELAKPPGLPHGYQSPTPPERPQSLCSPPESRTMRDHDGSRKKPA